MSSKEISLTSTLARSIPLARTFHRKDGAGTFGLTAVFVIGLVVVALISLLYLAQASAVAATGYDVKSLQDQQARLQMRNAQLRIRVAQLESLERVESEASARLKMGVPSRVLYLPVEARQPSSRFGAGP